MKDLVECIPSFARDLEILVVDHDTTSLMEIAWVLEQFAFKVTTTEMGYVALSMIEAKREASFNIVIANVHMLDMCILEFIRILIKKKIHVVLIATSEHTEMALKGLDEGASFFYEKPVSMDELRHVWQYFYRRNRNLRNLGSNNGAGQGRKETNFKLEEHSGPTKVPTKRGRKPMNKETELEVQEVVDVGAGYQETADDPKGKRKVYEEEVQAMSGTNVFQNKKMRANSFDGSGDLLVFNDPKGKLMQVEEGGVRLIEVDDEPKETPNASIGQLIKGNSGNKDREVGMEREEIISMSEFAKENAKKVMRDRIMSIAGDKRNRIVWTKELHFKFTQAVSLLGDDKALPKTILEIMNVPYLTHRQVASHLQKYKNQIKQISKTATPTFPTRPKSSSLNISRFQQVLEMTNAQAHEHTQGGWNLGGNITQSLQKPVAMHNATFSDARLSYNERLQLASSYIKAQNQNQLGLPFQDVDMMSANVFSRNQVPLPMQGLDAITGNVTSGNQMLMPIQGLNVMPGHVSPKKTSIPDQYLINFNEENKDLPATNFPARPGNQPQQQSLDDYYEILNSKILESSWDMDQYLDG